MNITELNEMPVTHRYKGIPGGRHDLTLAQIGEQGWNVLRQDLPLPLVVLKQSALNHNSRWMQAFLQASGASICPHGKTTMSPQLYQQQLDDGAWGITVATVGQLQVCRDFACRRVLMANQLVGKQEIRYVLDELQRDPEFDFYCLVDSARGVEQLAETAAAHPVNRPLQVLLERGIPGGRTGCRDLETALEIAQAVKTAAPHLALRGVEGFEGIIGGIGSSPAENETHVAAFMDSLIEVAHACDEQGLFAGGEIILTAGGSTYYDIVSARLAQVKLSQPVRVVIRCGCYLTHDSAMYQQASARMIERSATARELGEGLRPALEIWGYVQSRPEPTKAYLTMGKRDVSFDVDLPIPQIWFSPGFHRFPEALPASTQITSLNDQHAYLTLPPESPLQVGDMVACGISHPCTTFDKWQLIPVVNDDYDVVSAVKTFF